MSTLNLLGDEHVRTILAATSEEPKSVRALSRTCGISRTSVYRKIERLLEHDLVESSSRIDPRGNHYTVYEADLQAVLIVPEDGELKTDVCKGCEEANRLLWLWRRIRSLSTAHRPNS